MPRYLHRVRRIARGYLVLASFAHAAGSKALGDRYTSDGLWLYEKTASLPAHAEPRVLA